MLKMLLKHELQGIISGNGSVRQGAVIQAITAYLGTEAAAGQLVENPERLAVQEIEVLSAFIQATDATDTEFYLTDGFSYTLKLLKQCVGRGLFVTS
jgi:hypothetical protein